MSESRTRMIKALNRIVTPCLRESGFKGRFPHFQRRGPALTDLLTFQFDRYGGGFVLELGQAETDFSIVWPNGQRIPPDEVTPYHFGVDRRARIQKRPSSGTDGWFRFDQATRAHDVFEDTARDVLTFLDEMERVFARLRNRVSSAR